MRFRRFMRPLPHRDAMPPAPPPGLPPGLIVPLGARGETFVRHHAGPPEAPVLLLLHGWTASADLQWCTAYPALTERYSVLAVDHRGERNRLEAELRKLSETLGRHSGPPEARAFSASR